MDLTGPKTISRGLAATHLDGRPHVEEAENESDVTLGELVIPIDSRRTNGSK